MRTLWSVGEQVGKIESEGFATLTNEGDEYKIQVFDGAEGADLKISVDDLLELAFTIYEELG